MMSQDSCKLESSPILLDLILRIISDSLHHVIRLLSFFLHVVLFLCNNYFMNLQPDTNHVVSKESIDSLIIKERNRTIQLQKQILGSRAKAHDAQLQEIAAKIPSLPPQSCNLTLYTTLRGHQTKIALSKWSRDSSRIVSASQDGYMIIWDAVTGYKKHAIALDNQYVLACLFGPLGSVVAAAGLDNVCTLYKVQSSPQALFQQSTVAVLRGHRAYISECEFLDDNIVLTSSGDMSLRRWDAERGVCVNEYFSHMGDVLAMDAGSTWSFLSGGSDGFAKVWDARVANPAQTHQVSRRDVSCVKFFPDEHSFITGSEDGLLRLYDMRSDGEVACYSLAAKVGPTVLQQLAANEQFESAGLLSVDFSRSGRLFYASYIDYGCIIWDTLKGDVLGRLGTERQGLFNKVATSPDGDAVLTASWDLTVRVWSV